MAKLLLWVLALGCFAEAAKRCASACGQETPGRGVPKKTKVELVVLTEASEPGVGLPISPGRMPTRAYVSRNIAENRLAPRFILDDILPRILCMLIEEFPLRPISDPIGHLALVSRPWHAFFRSKQFWDTIITTPNAALYAFLAKKTFSFDINRAIFMSAKALLLEEERLKLIVEADDPIVLIALGQLSYGEFTVEELSPLYQQFRHTLPKELSPKGRWKKPHVFDQKLEVLCRHSYDLPPEEYALVKMGPVSLMRLFYLQDLLDPTFLNWLHTFLPQQVCQLYHRYPEFRPTLAAQMQELSRVTLPRSLTSLVFECMCYPMFIAMLVKDLGFIRMLGLNYDTLEELYAVDEHLIEDIGEFRSMAEGRQTTVSFGMINRLQSLLSKLLQHETCGFSVASIKKALGEVTERGNLKHGVFAKIQRYISSE